LANFPPTSLFIIRATGMMKKQTTLGWTNVGRGGKIIGPIALAPRVTVDDVAVGAFYKSFDIYPKWNAGGGACGYHTVA